MGLVSWFHDCWIMMMRTKPQYMSVLGRKRSSVGSPQKLDIEDEKSCKSCLKGCVCLLVMCCSISYGALLLLLTESSSLTSSNILVPLIVAGIACITGGMCLSEYMSFKPQEVPSIYSCSYQYSSEVLAFFIGWSWLLSQTSLVAAFCARFVDLLRPLVEPLLPPHLTPQVPNLLLTFIVVVLVLLSNSGLPDTLAWYVCSVPIVCGLAVTQMVLGMGEEEVLEEKSWFDLQSVEQILHLSSLCTLFFSGPQSILRLSHHRVHPRTSLTLGPLNLLSLLLLLLPTLLHILSSPRLSSHPLSSLLCLPPALESLRHLHFCAVDMASDGLLFRGLAKKARAFCCVEVASAKVQVAVWAGVVAMVTLAGWGELVCAAVVFQLAMNSVVPYLVLLQRYRDTTAWQYEPMLQTTARPLRSRSEEQQYSHGDPQHHQLGFDHTTTTTCIDSSTDPEEEEDIDSVVQQYRDQAKIAGMAPHEELLDPPREPTPASAARAKWAIAAHFVAAAMAAAVLNAGGGLDQVALVAAGMAALLLATVLQAVLLCFPQNGGGGAGVCARVPGMPWVPGAAAFINKALLVNAVLRVWPLYLGWIGLGLIVYFGYGIRSSTAANSFYNLGSAHLALCPLPSYGNKCVTQVVPSQRKKSKKKKLEKKNSSRRKPIMA